MNLELDFEEDERATVLGRDPTFLDNLAGRTAENLKRF
jgi:hypothetical protein